MSFYIFKKETWVYVLLGVLVLLILILILSIGVEVKNNDFVAVVDYGDGVEKKFTGDLNADISAWDILQQASANGIVMVDSGSDFYPNAIDSLENGKWGKNWALYINGKKMSESPISVSVKNGDMMLWKFE